MGNPPAPKQNGVCDSTLRILQNQREVARLEADAMATKLTKLKANADAGARRTNDTGGSMRERGPASNFAGNALEKTWKEARQAQAALPDLNMRPSALRSAGPIPGLRGPALDLAFDVKAPTAVKYSLTLIY